MTDTLRDRIAEALAVHNAYTIYEPDSDLTKVTCDCGWVGDTDYCTEQERHVADAILAIPGIAVVELPSFDSIEDDFGVVDNKVRHYLPSGFGAYREYRLNDARDLAAALLAAADYAERDQ